MLHLLYLIISDRLKAPCYECIGRAISQCCGSTETCEPVNNSSLLQCFLIAFDWLLRYKIHHVDHLKTAQKSCFLQKIFSW